MVLIRASVADNGDYLNKKTDDEAFYININSEQAESNHASFVKICGGSKVVIFPNEHVFTDL